MTREINKDKVQYYLGLAYLNNLEPEKALEAFKQGQCDIPKTEFADCGDQCFKKGLIEKAKKAYEVSGINEKERYIKLANELLEKGSVIESLKYFEISEIDPPEEKLHNCLQKLIEKGFYWDEIEAIYKVINLDDSEKKKLHKLCMEYLKGKANKFDNVVLHILKDVGEKEAMLKYANELVSKNSINKATKIFETIVQMDNK